MKHIDQHLANTMNLLLNFGIVTDQLCLSSSAYEIAKPVATECHNHPLKKYLATGEHTSRQVATLKETCQSCSQRGLSASTRLRDNGLCTYARLTL